MPNDPPHAWQDEPDPWDPDRDAPWGDDADAGDDDGHDHDGHDHDGLDTAFCPECGAEIHDTADICPHCYSWIDGDTTRRPPRNARLRKGGVQVVIWMLVAAMLAGAGVLWLAGVFARGGLPR
jgi:hypothetical protein